MRRQKKRIFSLKDMMKELQEKLLISSETAISLEENFSSVSRELFLNQQRNHSVHLHGRRYSEEIKKFAMTLHFYSPRAYDFIRTEFILPAPSSLSNWTSSVSCDPGFLVDVFRSLQEQCRADPTHRHCALIVDGVSIKARTPYNPSTGRYEGFVDFGNGILPENPDMLAMEARLLVVSPTYHKSDML